LFDGTLKDLVTLLLEDLVREKFNPFGHTDVKDSAAYLRSLRKQRTKQSDEAFLAEIEAWQKPKSHSR
jgi:hypothetical protein